MSYEKKDGDFILFEQKDTTNNKPNLKGTYHKGGKDYEMACWKKEKNGKVYFTGKLTGKVYVPKKVEKVEAEIIPNDPTDSLPF